jgi:3'(2'), 5'-bisphosphate nucleotidase
MSQSLFHLQSQLVALSQAAGQAILSIYHDAAQREVVDHKADDSPLTLADQASHQFITEQLASMTPEVPILSEEGQHLPYAERQQWERFWLVDPLDGTKEFIKRNGEFTVNIALVEGQEVVMGVVHVPVLAATYYAARGQGAYVIKGDAEPQRIEAQAFGMEDRGLRIVCSRSHLSPEMEAYLEPFDQPETLSVGSSLKLVMVAEGKADLYPRLGPTMEWDTAAAQIVVEEAGGQVISQDTQQPMVYNKANLLNPHFIVYGAVQATG